MINGKYEVEKMLTSNILCKLKIAHLVADPTQQVMLKVWAKQVLRSRKEYHRRKDGHGMFCTDELQKVLNVEVKAMLRLAQSGPNHSPNVVRLLEVIDDEAGFEDKLILVMEYCPGGQLLNWNPQTHTFSASRQSEQVDENGFVVEATVKTVLRDVAQGL